MAKSKPVYQLKIILAHVEPPVWRRVEVADCSLAKLHDVIQTAMGWHSCHLWAFDVNGEQYGDSDDADLELDMTSARKMKLSRLAADGVKRFRYVYDFGDNWEHVIRLEKTLEADPQAKYPRCVAGSRACPPEDCGGAWGYGDLLEALRNPKHKEHQDMKEWIGGDFDPEEFDLKSVNAGLAAVR